MDLTIDDLLNVFTRAQIDSSTYITPRGKKYIRLINSKPDKALVPALYPNNLSYKRQLVKYSNVIDKRPEFKASEYTGNQMLNLNLGHIDISTPSLPVPPTPNQPKQGDR